MVLVITVIVISIVSAKNIVHYNGLQVQIAEKYLS